MAITVEKLKELGARLFGEKASDESTLAEIEQLVSISDSYRQALTTIGGAIFFDNGARFTPDDTIPWQRPDGTLDIDMLFGLGRGEFSILEQLNDFKNQLPKGSVPLGDSPGGNLIISDEYGKVFFWDHETGRVYRITLSLDDFFSRLKPGE